MDTSKLIKDLQSLYFLFSLGMGIFFTSYGFTHLFGCLMDWTDPSVDDLSNNVKLDSNLGQKGALIGCFSLCAVVVFALLILGFDVIGVRKLEKYYTSLCAKKFWPKVGLKLLILAFTYVMQYGTIGECPGFYISSGVSILAGCVLRSVVIKVDDSGILELLFQKEVGIWSFLYYKTNSTRVLVGLIPFLVSAFNFHGWAWDRRHSFLWT